MATVLALSPPPAMPQKRFSVAEYHRLIADGYFACDERYELVRGYIIERPPINPPHATVVRKLMVQLLRLVGLTAVVRIQLSITLPDGEPIPDFVLAAGTDDDYAARHPGPDDCHLVIEVSDSSVAFDTGAKLATYAQAKVSVYWVVNIPDRRVEVYTQPRGGKSPTYRTRTDYAPGQDVSVVVAGKTLGSLPVSELLP